MKIIQHESIPTPKGHYTPVVEHKGTLYVSGQLPRLDDGTIPEGIEAQTMLVLEKMEQLLLLAGSNREHVLQVRIYIPDGDDWAAVNAVYADFFGDHRPARCIVPSRELHYGCAIELEAVACVIEG
jgi:enamine deaminase RidA (YjgF/YER057c/UK114 family)